MNSLDVIKMKIQKLYKTNPRIHINVVLSNPRVNLRNEQVVITGVYPHIFQIEAQSGPEPRAYTLQYSDVLIGRIEILELGAE